MHGRKMGEVMGKWAASGEGSWREEKTAARLLGGKKRKGKENGLGCCIGLRFGPTNGGGKWANLG